jgi:serine/threonine protein phosphatase 1
MLGADRDDALFARLPRGRTTWAVGAVFADRPRLAELHARLGERITPTDNLVYLGNILGGGRDVLGTLRELLLFRCRLLADRCADDAGAIAFVRGSQEHMWLKLLQLHLAGNPREVLEWMLAQGVGTTLEAYGGRVQEARVAANGGSLTLSRYTNRLRVAMQAQDGHQQLLSALKRAAFTADNSLLLVSAGLDPDLPLDRQDDNLWWNEAGFNRLDAPYAGFARVVRGFDGRHGGVTETPVAVTLDGGCGFGGRLVAGGFDVTGALVDRIEV